MSEGLSADPPAECAECGGCLEYEHEGEVYRREVGIVLPGVYDGILYWQCPWCGVGRHRWPVGSLLRQRAERHMDGEMLAAGGGTS